MIHPRKHHRPDHRVSDLPFNPHRRRAHLYAMALFIGNYRFQRRAWEQLQRRLLGKTLLFTDQAGWSDAELVPS